MPGFHLARLLWPGSTKPWQYCGTSLAKPGRFFVTFAGIMNSVSMCLLRQVASKGELSLDEALRVGSGRANDHRDQYPLALLIEDEYLGCTLNHTPPEGAENMREYSQVVALHMLTLPKQPDGTMEYMGITSSGTVEPAKERVFLKAKGALYLEEYDSKKNERLFAIFLGIAGAFLGAWFATWLK